MSYLSPDHSCTSAFLPIYYLDSLTYPEVSSCSEPRLASWDDSSNQCMIYDSTFFESCPSLVPRSSPTIDSCGSLDGFSSAPLMGRNPDGDELCLPTGYLPTSTNWIQSHQTFSNDNFLPPTQKNLPLFSDLVPSPQYQFGVSHETLGIGGSSTPDFFLSSPALGSNILPQNSSENLNMLGPLPEFNWNHSESYPPLMYLPSENSPEMEHKEHTTNQSAREGRRRVGRPRKYRNFLSGKPSLIPGPMKKCDVPGCGKKFVRQEHLKRHKKIHDDESVHYPCELCGKTFSRFDNFSAHFKLHGSNPDRPNRRTQYFPQADEQYKELTRNRRRTRL